ncbi:thioredoxin domain-containing protein [Nocardioides sp. YIM 152315]|uniref:thioredoxin domain-containing protein n=1 Tax=Nocardioides sp. YIM 152315 TaxID=3031760 RepID=UPI0023D9C2C1|nr:thioredoxin domain-containing protein [Nocardioides sp. YIM 152315]MDF1603322.1 thioredoxin domain-containing protein [Nocardioides sp. YIM 152315]
MANRLASATSPYLLQHAGNPVAWWEWEPAAFEEARRRNVPILLSVGYAACHWCHVMAHESFEDDATAAYLNEHFVSIKVDREERPDVDAVYMQATTSMTGHGGWPMTVVLDHDANPFFAGTYFPDQPRHGQPSFRQVLEALHDAWTDRGDEVSRVAETLREHLSSQTLATGASDQEWPELLERGVLVLAREFDQQSAGFGGAPKFPPSMVLEYLLRISGGSGARTEARRMLDATLEAMARGGIYDQLGGGFARYSVDRDWVVPHFEKMLYDNALLLRVYAEWGTELGERVARGVADFLLAELRTAEGGFASALDADSEGEEGVYYVWTPAQLTEALGSDDGAWAAALLSVTDAGTFERGTSTLQLRADPDDAERWDDVRRRLLEARAQRVRPARDDKVVAAWNGLVMSGLCRAGYVDAARAAGELVWRVHVVDGRLRRVSRDGVVGAPAGVLEDHGCVAAGFLDLLQVTGDPVWLERARHLLDTALDHFAAPDGGFFDTADDAEELVARPRDPSDNASPSGLSSMVDALSTYAAITGSGRHRDAAEAALATVAAIAEKAPRFAGWSMAAAVAMAGGPVEVAIVGAQSQERTALELRARQHPGAVVVVADEETGRIPLLAGRTPVDGAPAAYVCRDFACERPVTTVDQLDEALSRRR